MKSDPLIGHKLGPYKVLEKIAHGGMGEVYKGFHPALDRYVAIKVLGQSLGGDPALTERFQREAKAVAALRHPNIVQVFDFGAQGNVYYLVMEYVPGTDLRAEIDRRRRERKPFTPEEIIHLLGQVAEALDYAHQHGVIHRDVKPANVLLTAERQAILGDFGLAMLRDRVSQATLGHSFGTPEYIAPEQAIDSRAAVPQSDIYSLGGILYEIVTHHLPFEAESSISLALKHISEEPAPPRSYIPSLPPAVEAVILQALAKEPADRFPTARAMIEALRQAWLGTSAPPAPVRPIYSAPGGPARQASAPPPAPPPPPVTQRAAASQPAARPARASRPPAPASNVARPAPPAPSPRRWPPAATILLGIAGLLGAVVLGIIGLLLIQGRNPFAVAALATLTRTPTITSSPTKLPDTRTPFPSASPSPTITASASPAATAPAASATSTRKPTTTATPKPTNTPTPTPTPTLAPGQTLTRTIDSMVMSFVPGGSFLMGAGDDPDAAAHEKPQHQVTLSPFWMDQTEVTNSQYRLCVEAGACTAPVISMAYDDPSRADYPVAYVKWQQASDYCQWLAQTTQWDAHLPTEAQWEKAASWDPITGTKRRYPWGNEDPNPTLLNFADSGMNRPTTVGSYPGGASAYGILDMAGNVWEWVADWYDKDYYKTPNLPADPTGPAKGKERVMRGGSYEYGAREARTTHRDVGDPDKASGPGLGFRCAVSGERLP